jgi:hypothetical protein
MALIWKVSKGNLREFESLPFRHGSMRQRLAVCLLSRCMRVRIHSGLTIYGNGLIPRPDEARSTVPVVRVVFGEGSHWAS